MRSRDAEPRSKEPLSYSVDQPALFWPDFFKKRRPRPRDVAKMIYKLHEEKKHDHVCHAILAAILHNQSQPWMYDVLPFSMELADWPQEEIDRVLASLIDVVNPTAEAVTSSAAVLSHFGRKKEALRRYRQAAKLDPTRPEAYILSLKIAREMKDYDAIRFAAAGILTYDWGEGHQKRHRDAENAAQDAEEALRAAGNNDEADRIEQAVAKAQKRDLILKLTWAGTGDVDLIVEEPPGTICSIANRQTRGGGALVHDGFGPKSENCYEKYVCALGAPGEYVARIRYISGNIIGKRAKLTIVRYKGTSDELVRSHTIQLREDDRRVRLSLHQGRRRELAPDTPTDAKLSGLTSGRTRIPAVRPLTAEQRQAARRFGASRDKPGLQVGAGTIGVGFTPVVTVIPEGSTMGASAIVSPDRRYVRISVNPFFTNITDVFTFSFQQGGGLQGGGGNQPQNGVGTP